MKWYYWLLIAIVLLIALLMFLATRKSVKLLTRVGSYIISAPPGTGKSALACCLAQLHKQRVVSPFPIKLKKGYSYLVNYNDIFRFNLLASNYSFEERDLIILDELALKINSNDLDKYFKQQQEALGLFCKLIRHMFDGTLYMIEQHPDRIPKQAREKVEYFVQVKKMVVIALIVIFRVNLFTNLDDYNKVVYSRRQIKKLIKKGQVPPSYSGEALSLTMFFPRWWLKRYNSRALQYVHELKTQLSPQKSLKQAKSIDVSYYDLKASGLDKLDEILVQPKKKIKK